jgi:hypothetical protein
MPGCVCSLSVAPSLWAACASTISPHLFSAIVSGVHHFLPASGVVDERCDKSSVSSRAQHAGAAAVVPTQLARHNDGATVNVSKYSLLI